MSEGLRVTDVSKRLGGRQVLERVNLGCDGGVVAVIGPNGCGKSTLLRVVVQILAPDEGVVTVRGAHGRRALAHLGYVPEAGDPPPHLTVAELAALVAALKGSGEPRLPIERLGLAPFLDQTIASLSLGQRRRACLAAALVGDPWLLVLDEPTNGLDPGGVDMLATLLNEHTAAGGAALVATHDLRFADAVAATRHDLSRPPPPVAAP